MIYTDAHCHIVPNAGSDDISCRIYNATRPTDWEIAIDISERDDDRNFAAIGIHPWHIADAGTDFSTEITNILMAHPNMMVGEIGLDKFRPDMPRQVEIFTEQLEIAHKLGRPVHMHCVGTWDRVLHIFHERANDMPPVIVAHRFTGDPQQIQMLADKYNMFFSYSAPHDNANIMERIAATPTNRILMETDTFDADVELNELNEIIDAIAVTHHSNIDEMSEQIYQNIQRVISYVRPIA